MFDIMDMEDDKRNNLLQLTDSQMKVNAWVSGAYRGGFLRFQETPFDSTIISK